MTVEIQQTDETKFSGMSWGYLILLVIFAIFGLGVCVNLLAGYNPTKVSNLITSEWFCGSDEILDYGCSGVFFSRFGKPWGIPLPAFGAVYFVFVLTWLTVFGRKTLNIFFALFLVAGGGVSLVLLYILYFVLPGQCRWCLLVHLANGLLIVTGVVAFIRNGGLLDVSQFRLTLSRMLLVTFIVLALVGWSAAYTYGVYTTRALPELMKKYEEVRFSECYQRNLYAMQKARIIEVTADDHILGSRSAPVTVVVYKDYQCPHCAKAWQLVEQVVEKINRQYPKHVRIVLRHYPLSFRCNPYLKSEIHPYACSAARAAEAVYLTAGDQAFWKYNDLLGQYYQQLEQAPYLRIAEQMGISRRSFLSALQDPRIQTKIRRDAASFRELGVPLVVPTIFINGRYVDGWKTPDLVESLLREEIKSL